METFITTISVIGVIVFFFSSLSRSATLSAIILLGKKQDAEHQHDDTLIESILQLDKLYTRLKFCSMALQLCLIITVISLLAHYDSSTILTEYQTLLILVQAAAIAMIIRIFTTWSRVWVVTEHFGITADAVKYKFEKDDEH